MAIATSAATLSWARPLPLTSFDDSGPLAGLTVPKGDVVVQRQVLAQPGPQLAAHTWARLADGTPLITGAQRGKGWLVLVHTTANTAWSSLPLSGAFIDVLRRIAALAPGAGGTLRGLLAPLEVLDAQGHLGEPGPAAQPVAAADLATTKAGASHPAGLYGRVGAAADAARLALNLASAVPDLQALQPADLPVPTRAYGGGSAEIDLMPWLLLAALLLALADTAIGLQLRGLLVRPARAAAGLVLMLAVLPLLSGSRPALAADGSSRLAQATGGDASPAPVPDGGARPAAAPGSDAAPGLAAGREARPAPGGDSDEAVIAATSETRLAYVLTGVAEVDAISQAGLEGLTLILNRRTAVEAGEPRAVDLAVDDLNLFPLLYWPIPPDHPDLHAGVRERLDAYLRQGGMILFDTGDAATMIPDQPGPGPGERRLQQLLVGLNLPQLVPMPEDHTLTRSFYLLQDFPGRWTGSTVWVDRPEPGVNDGVSSIIVGGNGWAGAWAIDEYGMAMFPVVPGGERQRELARRFGVNLVMYALTGNYKTDQVHIPALLERLGQ